MTSYFRDGGQDVRLPIAAAYVPVTPAAS